MTRFLHLVVLDVDCARFPSHAHERIDIGMSGEYIEQIVGHSSDFMRAILERHSRLESNFILRKEMPRGSNQATRRDSYFKRDQ